MLKSKEPMDQMSPSKRSILPGFEVGRILTPVSFNAKRSIDCSNILYCASSNGKNPAN
jgi:hypothetical protein